VVVSELHIIGALHNKRSELAGLVKGLEQQLIEHRAALTHLDATMRLFDPDIRPEEIRPRQRRSCNAWFRPGECLRLLYDVLRDTPQPMATREVVERVTELKSISVSDDRQRALLQKTILASLNRARDAIERVETAGVVRWRVR
jgi:hypothetical protein